MPSKVYLLFGGHLAASLTPAGGSPRGWGGTDSGDNCGASSISGGPYHIKVTAVDGAAEGSRDNQIMSNAVLPLITPTLVTTPSASATTSASIGDSLNVGNANAGGGTATFILYPSAADCAADTNAVSTQANVAVSAGSLRLRMCPSARRRTRPTTGSSPIAAIQPTTSARRNTDCGDETATVNIATTSVFPVPVP